MSVQTDSAPMTPQWMRVQRVLRESEDVFTWELVFPSGEGFSYLPGQFNMLYLFGVGEVPISISGDASEAHTLVHTIRATGVVTNAMQKVKEGDLIGVRGPYGTPWPVKEAEGKDVVLVAGGLGLAPLRPAIYHLLHNRRRYGDIAIVVGARNPAQLLFLEQLQQWSSRLDVTVEATVDIGVDDWTGHVGLVTELLPRVPYHPLDTMAMVCGPEIMMKFASQRLVQEGVPAENIYVSMERNMKCGVGLCGHCQLGPHFVCKDGPVYPYPAMKRWFTLKEM